MAGAAWSVVRWDMSGADVEAAFDKAGLEAETKNDVKTGAERLAVKHGAWNAMIYFTAKKPGQLVVTGERLAKDAAVAVAAKMKQRAGAPTQTVERTEQRWRKAGAGATTFVIGSDGTTREEYVRDGASGTVNFAKLVGLVDRRRPAGAHRGRLHRARDEGERGGERAVLDAECAPS